MKKREMKDSGIEWIGDIPADWQVAKLKHSIRWKSVKGNPKGTVLSLYRDYGVIPKDSRDDNHNVTSLDTSTYKVVDVGDFVINKMKAWQGSMAVSEYCGIISPAYHVCKITNPNIYKKYFHLLLRNPVYIPEYTRLSTGMRIGQWDLGYDDFKNIPFIIPPYEEQKRVADFLDRICAEIDAVIAKTSATIEEYRKLKQSIITEAVTKGIRGDRPMKDSGVEWIGGIPESFTKYRIKNIGEIFGRIGFRGYTTDDLVEEGNGAITLSPSNLKDMTMNYSKLSYLSWEKYEESPEIKTYDGDILMVKTGSSYGKTALVTDLPLESTINPQLVVIKNISVDSKFLLYCFHAPYFLDQVENAVVGGTIPTMSQEKINNFFVFVPESKEQEEIVEYLDKKCAELDTLIAKKTTLLEEMESYKKSVIYEYVTGKKEV